MTNEYARNNDDKQLNSVRKKQRHDGGGCEVAREERKLDESGEIFPCIGGRAQTRRHCAKTTTTQRQIHERARNDDDIQRQMNEYARNDDDTQINSARNDND